MARCGWLQVLVDFLTSGKGAKRDSSPKNETQNLLTTMLLEGEGEVLETL